MNESCSFFLPILETVQHVISLQRGIISINSSKFRKKTCGNNCANAPCHDWMRILTIVFNSVQYKKHLSHIRNQLLYGQSIYTCNSREWTKFVAYYQNLVTYVKSHTIGLPWHIPQEHWIINQTGFGARLLFVMQTQEACYGPRAALTSDRQLTFSNFALPVITFFSFFSQTTFALCYKIWHIFALREPI